MRKIKETNSTGGLLLFTLQRAVETAISCKTVTSLLLPRATRSIHDMQNPQEPKPLQISHLFTRGVLSLSGSKLFTTAAVYARLDIYLQRERNGAAVSETGSSQVEIKRRSETNFILRTEERSVQVLVTPASWESCRETRLLFRLVLPFAYFPLPLENDEPSFNTM